MSSGLRVSEHYDTTTLSIPPVSTLQVSGLSMWIGRQLEPMSGLPPWAVTLLACLLVSVVTEFASNPATLTVFLPILSALVRVWET